MPHILLTVFCPDRTGLVAAVAGRLFDIGANLGDTNFAVLGTGAEFTSICSVPAHVDSTFLRDDLAAIPELAGATINARPFGLDVQHAPSGTVTHMVTIGGGDRPGLIARLSEVFTQFKANIVRMDAQTMPDALGLRYITRFAVNIPAAGTDACVNTVSNTAEELGLTCHWQRVEGA